MGALILAADNYVDGATHPFSVEDNAENAFDPGAATYLDEYGADTMAVIGAATDVSLDDLTVAQQLAADADSTLVAYTLRDTYANLESDDDDLSADSALDMVRDGASTYDITDLDDVDATDFTAAPLKAADAVVLGNASNSADLMLAMNTTSPMQLLPTLMDSMISMRVFWKH
jgi:hypothetical protein